MKQAVLILMCMVLSSYAQSCGYSRLCGDHTMCKYQGYGRNCGQPIVSGVNSAGDKQTIVDEHNRLRRQVTQGRESRGKPGGQPSAANMRKFTWDDELARVAQRWADQCTFAHDSCRKVGRFGVGQNWYYTSGTASPNQQQYWRDAVQAWYNEVKDFSRNDISPFRFSLSTGHYTQVVWADTYKVGCGFTAFKANGWYYKYYVCNYGPAGNMIGGKMYEVGPACSKCRNSCDNGLCN